jgi:L-threonylcarbamoyladenylate synthase
VPVLLVASSPPPPGTVRAAAAVLRRGQVVALPTDTVYGLAALPGLPGATRRLFELKGRAADVPIAVLCASVSQALDLAEPPSDEVRRIVARLWPGPLTVVLRRRAGVGFDLGETAGTIGLRCPDHDLVRALTREVGPLATTSANRHGEPTPSTAAEIVQIFADEVGLVVDGGVCAGLPSTVVEAVGRGWQILRPGPIGRSDIEAAAEGTPIG